MKFLMNSKEFFLNESDQMTVTNDHNGRKQLIIVPPIDDLYIDTDAVRINQQRLADEVEMVCDQVNGPLKPGRYVSRDLVLVFDKHGTNLKLVRVERNPRWKKGLSALDYPKGPEPVHTDGRSRYKKDWQDPEPKPEPTRDPEATKRAIQARLKPHLREGEINEAAGVSQKDWDRMLSLVMKGESADKVAQLIKDKNKAMARFVAGLKLKNQPIKYLGDSFPEQITAPYGYNKLAPLGEVALKLGATPQEIQDLYDKTEVPSQMVDKMSKLDGKKLNSRFVGAISKAVLDMGMDIVYLPHNGNAITMEGKEAMDRNGRKWTIGYKTEIVSGTNRMQFVFDAITDEGDGPTYYMLGPSDSAFDRLYGRKPMGKYEFINKLKNILKSIEKTVKFINEAKQQNDYELREFLVKNMGIKPSHIENYIYVDTKGNNRKGELLAMFNNADTPEKLEKFYGYIMSVIVPASSTLKKYLN